MKPHPTYYYGRRVVAVSVPTKGDEWEIEFEGGVVFKNQATKVKPPTDEIVGVSLLTISDDPDLKDVTLKFGTASERGVTIVAEVPMRKGKWVISDPQASIESGEHVQGLDTPSGDDPDTPADPSAERVADGPTVDPGAEQEADDGTDSEG